MPLEFRRTIQSASFLDPRNNFEPTTLSFEMRVDPLTGHTGTVYEYRYVKLEKPDLSEVVAKSLRAGCPACPEFIEKVTPKFPPEIAPEGRLHLGEACVFPNIAPYTPYSAVTVLSKKHFIALTEFTEETLVNGFLASQAYLKRVLAHDPEAKYCEIDWNYMPLSGAGLFHPHFQVLARYSSGRYHGELLEASRGYRQRNGSNFWRDFIAKEKELGERYIGAIGDTFWLTCFVSRGWMLDAIAVFEGKDSVLSLSQRDFADLSQGLLKVFNYMDDQDLHSFCFTIYSGLQGDDSLWTQARIVPRFTLPPMGANDSSYLRVLYDEFCSLKLPEAACKELKGYFAGSDQGSNLD